MNLRELQSSPAAFRDSLLVDADGTPTPLGTLMDDWQRDDFAALDPGWRNVVGQQTTDAIQRAYLERGRGSSKTTDLATMSTWALFASRHPLVGVAAAADRDQAKLLRDAIAKLVRLNPWLSQILDVQQYKIVNTKTGSTLEILSSDAATSYGLTPDFVIVDELTHWAKEDLWVSIFSAVAKRTNALLVIISNAGFNEGESWQWRIREAARESADWYFHRLEKPASWISAKHLAEQRRLLPTIAFDRLWLNRWTTGSGDALTVDDITAAMTAASNVVDPESGWAYFGGLDLGHTRDAAAFVVVAKHVGYSEQRPIERPPLPYHRRVMIDAGLVDYNEPADYETIFHDSTARLRVVSVAIWKPTPGRPVEFDVVERAILDTHTRLGLSHVYIDPWNAAQMTQRLFARGIMAEPLPFIAANLQRMATVVLDAFRDRAIDIPRDLFGVVDLEADLRRLRAVERSYGFRLESPRGNRSDGTRHGDTATALQLTLVAAGEHRGCQPVHVRRELVFYP